MDVLKQEPGSQEQEPVDALVRAKSDAYRRRFGDDTCPKGVCMPLPEIIYRQQFGKLKIKLGIVPFVSETVLSQDGTELVGVDFYYHDWAFAMPVDVPETDAGNGMGSLVHNKVLRMLRPYKWPEYLKENTKLFEAFDGDESGQNLIRIYDLIDIFITSNSSHVKDIFANEFAEKYGNPTGKSNLDYLEYVINGLQIEFIETKPRDDMNDDKSLALTEVDAIAQAIGITILKYLQP